MRILIVGAGKMGSFFSDVLSFNHEVGVYDNNRKQLRFVYNVRRMTDLEEITDFDPEIVINAVTVQYTIEAFKVILPFIGAGCMICDISSVKTGLKEFYETAGHPFASTHPMFGPTFANLNDLSRQNAIIIGESSHLGKTFFKDLYSGLGLNIFEYSFEQHDETIAYSLSIPFASTLAFASVMKHQEAPGTTFQKHMTIAEGLLSEDEYLVTEILFNPHTSTQVERIRNELKILLGVIEKKDSQAMHCFLERVRKNIRPE